MPVNDTVVYKSMEDLLQLTEEETQLAMKQFIEQTTVYGWGKYISLIKYKMLDTYQGKEKYFFKWTDASSDSSIESTVIQMLSLMLKDN